ncbi:hypothetical protein FBU30_010820 [Linnemannia zychae]|nr:hypothetical protein FBU30_010820 [Linnemannia zychae]
MSSSSTPESSSLVQQSFQSIPIHNTKDNHFTLPVHFHLPTGTRYVSVSALRALYPDIICIQVDGQDIQSRRGFLSAQSIVNCASSLQPNEATVMSNAALYENDSESQTHKNEVVDEGGFRSQHSSQGYLSDEIMDQTLPENDSSDESIEWIEYKPKKTIQIVYRISSNIDSNNPELKICSTGAQDSSTLSFWTQIRQEIKLAIHQYHQELVDKHIHAQPPSKAISGYTSSDSSALSWIAAQQMPFQPCHLQVQPVVSTLSASQVLTSLNSQYHDKNQEITINTESNGDRKRDRDEDEGDTASSTSVEKKAKSNTASLQAPSSQHEYSDGFDNELHTQFFSSRYDLSEFSPSSLESESLPTSDLKFSSTVSTLNSKPFASSAETSSVTPLQSYSNPSLGLPSVETTIHGLEILCDENTSIDPNFLITSGLSETVLLSELSNNQLDHKHEITIMSGTEQCQSENNHDDIDSGDDISSDESYRNIDSTLPFRFTNRQLRGFIARRNGLLVRDSQAVTINLRSSREANQFYKFLTSQDYIGRWLNIKLDWSWDRDQLAQLVDALTNSPIEILFLDGRCDRSIITSVEVASISEGNYSSSIPIEKYGIDQNVTGSTRSRHYDPLIRLLRNQRFKELHFYGMPNLLQQSLAPIPWGLNHLKSISLHAHITKWDDIHACRFIQLVKRANNLEHLFVGCPTERYMEYMNEIKQSLNLSGRNINSPSLTIYFQHYKHHETLLHLEYNHWDSKVEKFKVDLLGTFQDCYVQWQPVLEQLVDRRLTLLSIMNMRDAFWMDTLINWANDQYINVQASDIWLCNLQLDCLHFGRHQFNSLVELLELTQSRLQTLDLHNVRIPSQAHGVTWPELIGVLNITVLQRLQIKTSNLQDKDIDGVIDCLIRMTSSSKENVTLKKFLLRDARFSIHGEETFVNEISGYLPEVDVIFR